MRRAIALSLLLAFAAPTSAPAKTFERLVVVGASGDSLELDRPRGLADSLFDGASRFNRGHAFAEAVPRGPYVRLYPLGTGGHVGAPGRFYPRTAAVCLSWDQGVAARPCQRANPTLRRALQRSSRRLILFRGRSATLTRFDNPRLSDPLRNQLRVAIELAFDRHRLAVRRTRPAACIAFRAAWRHDGGRRPRALCLGRRGVYAAGRLYPLGPAPWDLTRINVQ